MIAQRNAIYQKVQQAQPKVDTSVQSSVDQFNALVAQANALNDKTTAATNSYQTHVTQVNGMISQYNTMR